MTASATSNASPVARNAGATVSTWVVGRLATPGRAFAW